MSNPNIVDVTEIYGLNACLTLTTSMQNLIVCPSDKICKINSIIVSNIDGVNAASVSVQLNGYYIAYTVSVPADSSLVVISKDTGLYCKEAQVLRAHASANSDLQICVSYEQIGTN